MSTAPTAQGPVDVNVSLEWTAPSAPNNDCRYNHCVAETPFGRFLLTWKGWKDYPDYGFDETPWGDVEYHGWPTVEDAQQWALQEMKRRVKACLKALSEDREKLKMENTVIAASPLDIPVMYRPPVADRYSEAVKLPDGSVENFTLRVGGEAFQCSCGCNVFHKPDKKYPGLYGCNGCEERYEEA